MNKRFLNLGCGYRIHPDWENVDFVATAPSVRIHDLRERFPFADQSFDAVYHSHLLEHFRKQAALAFLRECNRVLKPGGIIRVAVPDLEAIARLYLEALEKASVGVPGWANNYEWMVMEMLDQCVREQTCGALIEYFRQDPIPNWEFISARMGAYGESVWRTLRPGPKFTQKEPPRPKIAWTYVLRNPTSVLHRKLLKLLLGQEDWEALQVGRFRRAGEVHMWMYDSYSLGKLLGETGFTNVQRVRSTESRIPGWATFCLDSEPDGRTYKADSMYMEAFKPQVEPTSK